jgi:uncharacterized protein YjbJ (UPF0337 family)
VPVRPWTLPAYCVKNQEKMAPLKRGEEKMLKPSVKNRAEGKLHEVKGKVREEVGRATNDPNLEISGKAEKNAGKVQKWIGRAQKAVGG